MNLVDKFPALKNLLNQFDQLSSRDQLALKGLGGFAVVLIIYFALVSPIFGAKSDAQTMLSNRIDLYSFLNDVGPRAKANARAAGSSSNRNSNVAISSTVTRTFSQNQITLQKFENDNNGGLRIWVENVPFDKFAQSLARLETSHGIVATQVTIESEGKSGVVSGRGVLAFK